MPVSKIHTTEDSGSRQSADSRLSAANRLRNASEEILKTLPPVTWDILDVLVIGPSAKM